MPSLQHEAFLELFRHQPTLAAELLSDVLGVELPVFEQARLESGDLTEFSPTEYRADTVVVLLSSDEPVAAVIVEAQLGRDPHKRWSWPVYLTTLRARLRCPVLLLVMCAHHATATWCAKPIELGHPGAVITPLVMDPELVPLVVDTAQAMRAPELTVLSAIAHGSGPEQDKIFPTLLAVLGELDAERATLYHDIVLAALPEAAQRHLEELMASPTYEYQSEFVRKHVFQGRAEGRLEGRVEGRVEGETAALLKVLATRGLTVSDDARRRITECADSDQLLEWIQRAITVNSVQELFV